MLDVALGGDADVHVPQRSRAHALHPQPAGELGQRAQRAAVDVGQPVVGVVLAAVVHRRRAQVDADGPARRGQALARVTFDDVDLGRAVPHGEHQAACDGAGGGAHAFAPADVAQQLVQQPARVADHARLVHARRRLTLDVLPRQLRWAVAFVAQQAMARIRRLVPARPGDLVEGAGVERVGRRAGVERLDQLTSDVHVGVVQPLDERADRRQRDRLIVVDPRDRGTVGEPRRAVVVARQHQEQRQGREVSALNHGAAYRRSCSGCRS